MNLQELLLLVSKHFGYQVGVKVKSEIEKVINAENIDINRLQSAIETIQKLLDADPSTPEFDVGQNIVTQLADHLNKINALQAQVDDLKSKVTESTDSLRSELEQKIADTKAELESAIATAKSELESAIATAKEEAVATAKEYTDNAIKAEIEAVDVCKLADAFAKAIDCGLAGKTQAECASDCSNTTSKTGNTTGNTTGGDTGSTDSNNGNTTGGNTENNNNNDNNSKEDDGAVL